MSLFNISFVVCLIWAIFAWTYIVPRTLYSTGRKGFSEDILKIRSTGKLLLSRNCGGRIANMNFTIGMLKVDVYDCGMIFSSPLFYKSCLLRDEITDLLICRESSVTGTKILHSSKRIKYPIIIYHQLEEARESL